MPRGVRGSGKAKPRKTTSERIADIDAAISRAEDEIKALKAQKRNLNKEGKSENKVGLSKTIAKFAKQGITPDQLEAAVEMLRNKE